MAEEEDIVAPPPTEFNKNLRCCVPCRLVKTLDQFYEQGCENCPFLEMIGDRERIDDCTTTEFTVGVYFDGLNSLFQTGIHLIGRRHCHPPLQGVAAVIDPKTSWVSKWLHHRNHVPGVYALSVQADLPLHITDILADKGITLRHDD